MRRFHFALLALLLSLAAQLVVAATYYVGNCRVGAWSYTIFTGGADGKNPILRSFGPR
jgi:hypothetical protein